MCKSAHDQPFKYLCKYFNIEISEETLSEFETVLNNFDAADQGKYLLLKERECIIADIQDNIPSLILRLSKNLLLKRLGFESIDLSDLHFPVYTFQYISVGGKSSIKCEIRLDIDNLNKFIAYLSGLIDFKNSIK